MPETIKTRRRLLRERDGVIQHAMISSHAIAGEGEKGVTIVLSPELADEITKARRENREEVGEFPLDNGGLKPNSIKIIIDSDKLRQ